MLAKLDCVSDFSRKLIPIFLATFLFLLLVNILYGMWYYPFVEGDEFLPIRLHIFEIVADVHSNTSVSGILSVSE